MSWQRIGLNSGYIMLATASLALLQWAMMAIIARLEGPSVLGYYALGQAYAMPASYLAWLSIRQQYLVSRDRGSPPADFMFLRIVAPACVFGLLICLLGFVYGWGALLLVCAGVIGLKYVEGFFDLAYGRMQQAGDLSGLARVTFMRCFISLILFASVYVVTRNLPVSLILLTLAWIAIYWVQAPRLGSLPAPSEVLDFSRPVVARRLALAGSLVPFALSNVVMSLTTNAPRFLIEHEIGAVELGLFAAVFHFVTIGAVATGSIGHAILPGLAAAVQAKAQRAFWRQLAWPMALVQVVCGIGVLAAILIGADVIRLVYGAGFSGQGGLLVAAAIAAGPVYSASLAANGCYAAQLRRGLLAIQCLSLFIVVVATLSLVPSFGAIGAMAGIMIAALVQIFACVGMLLWFWLQQSYRTGPATDDLKQLCEPGE